MGVKDGKTYIQQIDKLHNEVWIDGHRIEGLLSEHRAYRGAMATQAELYDMQLKEDMQELLTYESDTATGERSGLSYLPPREAEDLIRRRVMIQEWAAITNGFMGRSPDYMNSVVMLLGETAELFAEGEQQFADNARAYAQLCRKYDMTLTHTFVRPQTNRSMSFMDSVTKDQASARIVGKTPDGLIIRGALLLATQGGMTDELLVFPGPIPRGGSEKDNPYAFAFAIPSNTKGLRFIARDSFDNGRSAADAPLSSRFEEMDTAVVFDDVCVPWERVFIAGRADIASSYFYESNYYAHITHQVACRRVVKLEFMLGLVESLVDALSIREHLHIQEKVVEAIVAYENMRALMMTSELDAAPDQWGLWMPDPKPLNAACLYFAQVYPRIAELVQLIGASGLVGAPSLASFESPLRPQLESYLQTGTMSATERVKLFRLAWDATMSAFGTRQTLYERFFFGDPARLAGRLYAGYDKWHATERVRRVLED
ncbi:4-hydroxyphenylacetate 3-monooxygenase, oxygenase component [Paenibacillus sp. YYML68]|uniref:4-hydroxyphenylacetate 3-monooxygenase, oxygenase component n=1 Tax=Paenibacillus sp. YYML68 TaxID=2909250 RepID=UPI002491E838|nr:4-hydroxyphenylacetate 3-monooxygenase, oxygenase component [Paenibacillus sp. YYML68]